MRFFEVFFVLLRSMNRLILILCSLAAASAVAQAKYYVPDSLLLRQVDIDALVHLLISVILALVLTILGLMVYLYRTKQKKNRALFRQIKEKDQLIKQMDHLWQQYPSPVEQKYERGNTKQQLLFGRFHAYLLQDKNFTNPDMDYIKIATALTTNKTYLYEAVKVVSGKSPIEYINGLRVDETRKMLESRSDYSIMVIASECGFNSYRTFQRLFRKTYRLSPAEYCKLTKTE